MEEDNHMYDQLTLFTGGQDVKPVDVSADLPRQTENSYKRRKRSDIQMVVLHTTDWNVTPEDLAQYDITPFFIVKGKKIYNHISKKGCPAITYHECIEENRVLHTLDWEEVSWHAGNWNKKALGIAMMYKASQKGTTEHKAPPEGMLKLAQCRAGDICLELGLTPDKVVGHRELKGTGWFWEKGSKRFRKWCPGKQVDMDEVRKNVALYMQVKLLIAGHYRGKVDGDFGPKSRAALEAYNV
jgi:hypothetical protein